MITWLPSHAERLVAVASTGSARPGASSARARSTEDDRVGGGEQGVE